MRNRVIGLAAALLFAAGFSMFSHAQPAPAPLPQEDGGGGGGRQNLAPGPPHDAKDLNGTWLGPFAVPTPGGGRGGAAAATGAPAAPKPNTYWSKVPVTLTAAGMAQWNANKPTGGPRGVLPAFGNDPMGGANPPGLVRTFSYYGPGQNGFEYIQTPTEVAQLFSWYHFYRQIWTDGSKLPADPNPYWYGHSVGSWDGDTFVVDTNGMDSRAWMDSWGTPMSDDMKIQERWHRTDQDNMELTITFSDPTFYTKTWTSEKEIYRFQPKGSKLAKFHEVIFAPMDEERFNEKIRDPVAGVKTSQK